MLTSVSFRIIHSEVSKRTKPWMACVCVLKSERKLIPKSASFECASLSSTRFFLVAFEWNTHIVVCCCPRIIGVSGIHAGGRKLSSMKYWKRDQRSNIECSVHVRHWKSVKFYFFQLQVDLCYLQSSSMVFRFFSLFVYVLFVCWSIRNCALVQQVTRTLQLQFTFFTRNQIKWSKASVLSDSRTDLISYRMICIYAGRWSWIISLCILYTLKCCMLAWLCMR